MNITVDKINNYFLVNQPCTVELIIRASETLLKGDLIEVQLPNSWYSLNGPSFTRNVQSIGPNAEHYISFYSTNNEAKFEVEIVPRQLNFPGGRVRHGKHIIAKIIDGNIPANSPIKFAYANTFAPFVAETDTIWIQIKGEAPLNYPAITVIPGPAVSYRIIIPSGVEPGDYFDVLVVSLDQFDNCSSTKYENETLYTDKGDIVCDKLTFTGSVRVQTKIESEGVFRFKMFGIYSNAIRVAKGCRGPYWGDTHFHTKLSHDGQGTNPYKYSKDVSGLDFACVTDHWYSLGEEGCKQILQWARDAYLPGKFVTILGNERNPSPLTGDHNIYFCDEEHYLSFSAVESNVLFSNSPENSSFKNKIYPSSVMLIPHHTGISWRTLDDQNDNKCTVNLNDWDDHGLRPVIEIYSHHGQSELWDPQHCLSYEFNRMRRLERRSNASVPGPYYAQNYWMSGWRLGVIASSDEHLGQNGRRHGGIAGVFAKTLTRKSIFDAIRNKQCYATTGERVLIDFAVDDISMGLTGKILKGKKIKVKLKVWGTAVLLRVEILRYRFGIDTQFVTILSESPRPETLDIAYEFEDIFENHCMYYARITQEPLEWPDMAWTSPVWIDTLESIDIDVSKSRRSYVST